MKEKPKPKPADRENLLKGEEAKRLQSSPESKSPVDVEFPADKAPKDRSEYGYGFWMRYLTTFPERLMPGKNAPWYFVARLTRNIPHADAAMGDRVLAIW